MDVFLSWSGERSKKIASALNNWIPKVIQVAQPWMSAEDISTGARWNSELNQQLENTAIGIICITPENQHSIWLHFEAGSLSKSLTDSKVMPLLLELTPGQFSGPMSQFQAVTCSKEGVGKILTSINESLGEKKINDSDLLEIFDVWWPKLNEQIENIGGYNEVIPKRESDDILEEVLDILREQRRNSEENKAKSEEKKDEIKSMIDHTQKMMNLMDAKSKESANLEKQKLAFLANSGQANEANLNNSIPNELAALIDKQGENPMKEMIGLISTMQQSFLESIEEDEDEDEDECSDTA